MYKDQSKQKEANKAANKRYRDKQKGITEQGITQNQSDANDRHRPKRAAVAAMSITPEGVTGLSPETTTAEALFEQALLRLPPGPTRPTGRPTPATSKMTANQLKRTVSSYHGLGWINSPEYAEVIYRLLSWTTEDLQQSGQLIPAWRDGKEKVPA
ncbi:hypothetical protein LCGC14_0885360 [marine sediment metagenome]|uniref:Uncharacterized protein n=1 Tax=marine sediment metagenome TaxID=412755 RepID=A0A0F9RKA0_9ZZZZ